MAIIPSSLLTAQAAPTFNPEDSTELEQYRVNIKASPVLDELCKNLSAIVNFHNRDKHHKAKYEGSDSKNRVSIGKYGNAEEHQEIEEFKLKSMRKGRDYKVLTSPVHLKDRSSESIEKDENGEKHQETEEFRRRKPSPEGIAKELSDRYLFLAQEKNGKWRWVGTFLTVNHYGKLTEKKGCSLIDLKIRAKNCGYEQQQSTEMSTVLSPLPLTEQELQSEETSSTETPSTPLPLNKFETLCRQINKATQKMKKCWEETKQLQEAQAETQNKIETFGKNSSCSPTDFVKQLQSLLKSSPYAPLRGFHFQECRKEQDIIVEKILSPLTDFINNLTQDLAKKFNVTQTDFKALITELESLEEEFPGVKEFLNSIDPSLLERCPIASSSNSSPNQASLQKNKQKTTKPTLGNFVAPQLQDEQNLPDFLKEWSVKLPNLKKRFQGEVRPDQNEWREIALSWIHPSCTQSQSSKNLRERILKEIENASIHVLFCFAYLRIQYLKFIRGKRG